MNEKIISTGFFLFYMMLSVNAQSPYSFDWKKETAIIGISGGLMATGYTIQSNINPLSEEDIAGLRRSNINQFDRSATYNYSSVARRGSDIGLASSYLLPFLFLADSKTRKDFKSIAILYGETMLASKGITNIIKRTARRTRPFVYNEEVPLSEKVKLRARYSFLSGHTSVTAANSFFIAKVFSDYFPDSDWKPYVWSAAIVLPAMTGYFRVKGGKHFPTDVISGYFVGAAIGYLIPHIHRNKKGNKTGSIQLYPNSNGMQLVYVF